MRKNLIPPNTVIETSDTGVLAICDCSEQRPDDELVAHGAWNEDDTHRESVYVTRDGVCTGRYTDGVMGVTDEDKIASENDEEPFCEGCGNYIRGWLHYDPDD